FHVKSSSASIMIVLVTVRVLPFFLTVTFIFSGTLMVSTFGARWYTDQRYWSTQVSVKRHSSGVSTELTAPLPCTGSGVLADSTCPDGIAGRAIGRGSGKAASIATLVTETPSSPIAVACRASMGSESDLAQSTSVGAPVFSMSEPKSTSPPATQLARTTVP